MPLLRLTSLIVASLLLAALSALVPAPSNPPFSVSGQRPAPVPSTALAVQSATRSNGGLAAGTFSSLRQREAGLVRIAGQSVPETGQ